MNAQTQNQNFLDVLNAVLVERQQRNTRYSLRAFARSLSVEPAFLSKILKGKKNLTPRTIERFGVQLELPRATIEDFKAQAIRQKELATPNQRALHFLNVKPEEFAPLAHWYFFAALELLTLSSFKPEKGWLAQKLDIEISEAEQCLETLLHYGYLKRKGDDYIKHKINLSCVPAHFSSTDMKRVQKEFLEHSIQSLENVEVAKRDHTGMTMSIPASKVSEAKDLIRKFRRKFVALMQASDDHDAVYQLAISFFPLTSGKE